MAIQIIPILRVLAPIVANASSAVATVAGMRNATYARTDEQIQALELELVRVAEVTMKLAEQTQALADQMRLQVEAAEAQAKRLKVGLVVASAALGVALVALIVALTR